jgi:putative transposase
VGRRPTPVTVSQRLREILEGWLRASKTPQVLAVRARIVLMSADKEPTWKQRLELKTDAQRVSRWRVRWGKWQERLAAAEGAGAIDKELEALVLSALSDAPRSGTPPKFTPEQLTAIIALACEKPQDSGLPVSHWTPAELAREAIKRGIVDSISPRHIDRFLKRSRDQTAQEPVLADIAG